MSKKNILMYFGTAMLFLSLVSATIQTALADAPTIEVSRVTTSDGYPIYEIVASDIDDGIERIIIKDLDNVQTVVSDPLPDRVYKPPAYEGWYLYYDVPSSGEATVTVHVYYANVLEPILFTYLAYDDGWYVESHIRGGALVTVGGTLIAVNKFALLAPYIGFASTVVVAAAATAIYVKRVRRRKEKQ